MTVKVIKAVLGNYPEITPIKTGALSMTRAAFDFTEYPAPYHGAFKPMVNHLAYDLSEMAIVTHIIAKSYHRPVHLLPVVMLGRDQHPFASISNQVKRSSLCDMSGLRVGMRSFAQTTVTWQRGFLKCDFGADFKDVIWIKTEDGHVPEAFDPAIPDKSGKTLEAMLVDGDIDIALGAKIDHPTVRPLFGPDPDIHAKAWKVKHGCVPINHVIVVTEDMVANHIDHIAEFYELVKLAKAQCSIKSSQPDPKPIGFEALRPAVETIIGYMTALNMLPHAVNMDDLIDPRIREAIGE